MILHRTGDLISHQQMPGIVLGLAGAEVEIFCANGLQLRVPVNEAVPMTLPGSIAVCNFRELLQRPTQLGATGNFPAGAICEEDEGELKVAILGREGRVWIEFGKRVGFIAMLPVEALQTAVFLMEKAKKLDPLAFEKFAAERK